MIPSVDVYLSAGDDGLDVLVGRARFNLRRGRVSTAFSYDEKYLTSNGAFAIDPALPLQASPLYVDGLPGAFRDSAPDRWGRHLISRRLREDADATDVLRSLDDADYLLGVHDDARQGALRYSAAGSDERLSADGGVPPRIELPRLLAASNRIAGELGSADDVKTLLDAGSGSLGGARPKASVVDGERLLLAKFSHPGDEWHVMRWERFALFVAREAGLGVPDCRLVSVGPDDALLLERFDREGSRARGRRLPYMSAMTLLGAQDGEGRDYAELAEALVDVVSDAGDALRDVFVRAALSIAIHNTDDHLRNMGLVRAGHAWRLAPCFDVNPNPALSEPRVTGIFGEVGASEAEGLRALAPTCGLSEREAAQCVSRVLRALRGWRAAAMWLGCPRSEVELFAPVFADRCEGLVTAFR